MESLLNRSLQLLQHCGEVLGKAKGFCTFQHRLPVKTNQQQICGKDERGSIVISSTPKSQHPTSPWRRSAQQACLPLTPSSTRNASLHNLTTFASRSTPLLQRSSSNTAHTSLLRARFLNARPCSRGRNHMAPRGLAARYVRSSEKSL